MTSQQIENTEQRIEKRLFMHSPVFVHGTTETGERIKFQTITDNISQGGLFLQNPCPLQLGSYVFTFTQLQNGEQLAARGEVVRVEQKENGLSGLAVSFHKPRLISTS